MTDQQHPLAGQTSVDADSLTAAVVTDLSHHGGGEDPSWDIFVDK